MKNATEQLEKGKILPLVFKLTVPAVIAQLVTFLYNVVDRVYVAKTENGMDALAALGIVLPVTLIISSFANLVGMGGSPRASMKLGEGDQKEANKIFNLSVVMLTAFGIIISLVAFFFARQIVVAFGCPDTAVDFAQSYLEIYALGTLFVIFAQGVNPFITAQGYSVTAMLSVLIGAVANIALDPLFIFAFGMGVKGAALATILSQAISFVWIAIFVFSPKNAFRLKFKDMSFSLKRVFSILSLGFSPFVMTITECAIQIVFNVNLNMATGGDKDYTAALTIMLSALQLISLPLNGLGYGMQPFVSYNYGKGNTDRLKRGIKDVTIIAFVFGTTLWLVSMLFPGIYAFMFSASDNVREIVVKYAPLFLMGSVMFFVQMTLQNINVALGRAGSALILAVTRKVIILIPLCFVLTHFFGFVGVYMSEGIADLTAGIITAVALFTGFPRAFKKRERELAVAAQAEIARNDEKKN